MARNQRTYDNEYKVQAVKLTQKIGGAKELAITDGTIYCWIKAFKEGRLSASEATHPLRMHYLLTMNLSNLENVLKSWIKKIVD